MLCSVDDLHKKNDSFAQLFTYVLKTLYIPRLNCRAKWYAK